MDTNNNKNLNTIPSVSNTQSTPCNTTYAMPEKPSVIPSIFSLILGIVGSILALTTTVIFIFMLLIIVGFALLYSDLSYIITFSIAALGSIILGVGSVLLGAKHANYYKVLSSFGIVTGYSATALGLFNLIFFWGIKFTL